MTASTSEATPPQRLTFDSEDIASDERFEAYHALYRGGTDVSPTSDTFRARVEAQRMGQLVMVERHLNGAQHERTLQRVRTDGFEHFTLQLVLSGRLLVETPDQFITVSPGQAIVFDLSRPQRTRAENAHYLTFSVAREMVEAATLHAFALHGTVLAAEAGLLADLMVSLVRRRAGDDPRQTAAGMQMFEEALALALGRTPVSHDSRDALSQARLVVEKLLARRDLDPDMIARHANLSRTTLYDLFRPYGGVSRYVQMRRTARLRALLGRVESRTSSIAELSYQVGFAAESHAARLYKAQYGETPGQRRQGSAPLPRGIETNSGFDPWIRALYR